jgi:hypothetical protein
MDKTNQLVGNYKEFITIERRELNTLQGLADELMDKGSKIEDAGMYQKGMGINYAIEWIKENNIYNKEFEIKG